MTDVLNKAYSHSELLTATGTTGGLLTFNWTGVFRVGAICQLSATGQPTLSVIINQVLSETTLTIIDALAFTPVNSSAYDVANGALLTQPEQFVANAALVNTITGQLPVSLDGNGYLKVAVQGGGGLTNVNQGSPNTLANAWPIEITDGTNGPVSVTPSSTTATGTEPALVVQISPNNPIIDANVEGTGTAGAPATGVVTIQGIAGGTAVPISGSISATNPSVGVTGTTAPTSATEIGFISGANLEGVSASNPLPITGSISATNPSVSATGSAVPNDATFIGGKNGSGDLTGFSTDSSGNLNVNVISGGGSNASVGTNQAAIPTSSTQIGASDGTDLQELLVESATHPNLRIGIYNGATEASVTGANALKVDGSAVTQPISGTVTVQQTTGSNLNADVSVQASGVFSHALNQDGSGNIGVNIENTPTVTANAGTGTFTVSGTVTANAGTNLNTSALALDTSVNGILVSQASTTSGEKGPLIQGAVTTTAPTYTNAETNPLSLNTSGGLRVDGSGVTQPISASTLPLPTGASTSANQTNGNQQTQIVEGGNTATVTAASALKVDGSAVTQPVSGTVTANAGSGTFAENLTEVGGSAIALGQTTMSASLPVAIASNQSAIPVTESGTWTVQPGNTPNTSPWLTTINQGGNSATVTGSNALKVDGSAVTQPVSGTVTANAGTGNFTVVQTTASNLNATVSGTVTSNQGTANTLANAWTTEITDGTHGPVAVKAPNTAAVAADPAIVVAISPNNTITTSSGFTADRTATGTITSSQNVAINTQGTNTCSIKITGSWTGTLSFQGTLDGTNWDAINAVANTTGVIVTSTTANGDWFIAVGGIQQIRVLGNTVATGTATAELDAGVGAQIVSLGNSIPTGSNVIGAVTQSGTWTNTVTQTTASNLNATVTQGTAATLSGAWPVEVTDGTNVLGTSAHPIRIDPTGTTTQPVSGTVTANAGTGTFTVSGTVTANAGSGSFTVAQSTASNLLAEVGGLGASGSATVGNPVQIGGVHAGDTYAIATDTSGNVGVNVENTPAVSQSGTWTVQPGNTPNTTPWLATINQGGNSASVTGSNALKVDGSAVTQPVSGTVTANAGTGNFTVVQATASSLNATVTGTVTSNQGTANSLANAWPVEVTDGTNILGTSTHPIRIDPTGTTTQPISGTVTANAGTGTFTVSGTVTANAGSGTFAENLTEVGGLPIALGQTTMSASLPVAIASNQSILGIKETDLTDIAQSLTMTSTSNAITLALGTGQSDMGVQITGATWTGTIIFEGNIDGSNWFTIPAIVPTTGVQITTTTSNGDWIVPVAGLASARVRVSVAGTNSATVSLQASVGTQLTTLANSLPTGSNVIGAVTQSGGPWTVSQATASNLNATVVQTTASNLNAAVVGVGTAGTPSGGVLTVQGSSSGTALPISGTVTANAGTGTFTISGTTTSNQGTANTLANAWPVEITDGTNGPAAVKAASTAAVATDKAQVVAISPNNTVAVTESGTWTVQPGNTPNTSPWLVTGSGSTGTPATGILTIQGNASGVAVPVSGTVTASNPSVGTNGSAFPTSSTQIGFESGSNLVAVSASNPLPITGSISATNPSVGTIGSTTPTSATAIGGNNASGNLEPPGITAASTAATAAQLGLVVAISPNSPLPTGTNTIGALTANQSINTAQVNGSTVSTAATGVQKVGITGNTGAAVDAAGQNASAPANEIIVGGEFNTSPTTITSGNVSPLQLDNKGNLLVNLQNQGSFDLSINLAEINGTTTVTGGVNGSLGVGGLGTAGTPSGGVLTVQGSSSGTLIPVQPPLDSTPSTQNITAQDVGSTSTAEANGQNFVTGSATSGSTATFTITTQESIKMQVTGSWTGTVTSEISLDGGTTWTASDLHQTGTAYTANTFTANFIGGVNTSGCTGWRLRATAAWTGTATVKVVETVNTNSIYVTNAQSVRDGSTQSITNTIKAASTATVAGDTSIVTALSPNSPLPAGTNTIGSVNQGTPNSLTNAWPVETIGHAGAAFDATLAAGTAPANGLGILSQYNTSQPAPTNTQTVSLQSDQSGNLLTFPGSQIKTGTAWNSSTTINTFQYPTGTSTVGAPLSGEAIVIQFDQTTTITGGAVTFQGTFDNINWVSIPIAQILNPNTFVPATFNPYTFVASTNQPFLILLYGYSQIRLNLTTVITGTGTVTPYWASLSYFPYSAVGGLAPAGSAVSGSPVLIGGSDGTNMQDVNVTTKGAQGARGIAVQNLKDAGRSVVILSQTTTAIAATATVAAITTLIQNRGGVQTTGITAFNVPANETLRIQNLQASACLSTSGAVSAIGVQVQVRVATTNTTTAITTGPIFAQVNLALVSVSSTTVTMSSAIGEQTIPDGLEIAGSTTTYVGITIIANAITGTPEVTGVTLIGYTY